MARPAAARVQNMEYGYVAVCTQTLQPPTSVETVHRRPRVESEPQVHPSSDLAPHRDTWTDSPADHAPARSPPITQSPLSNPLLTSTLSHPLSYAIAARQNTNAVPHRSRRPRFARCFQRPVLPRVARDVGTACKKGPWLGLEPSHLCISPVLHGGPSPHSALGGGLYSRTRRPQAAPLSQRASAKRPLSAPSI